MAQTITRVVFQAAAKQVREYRESGMTEMVIESIEEAYIQLFSSFNPLFDVSRFKVACQSGS